MSEKSFVLLIAGYFVCGFQVVFIGVHFPSYLIDKGMDASTGMTALALIGLFNVFGTTAPATWAVAGPSAMCWPLSMPLAASSSACFSGRR